MIIYNSIIYNPMRMDQINQRHFPTSLLSTENVEESDISILLDKHFPTSLPSVPLSPHVECLSVPTLRSTENFDVVESDVVFSIVVPVHNQESIIVRNVESILKHTTGHPYELIMIFDACDDNTETVVMDYFSGIQDKENFETLGGYFRHILLLQSRIPLFETACDNLGCLYAKGKYILEIQADMEMTQYGYNMKLLQPFQMLPNVLGISGRCCHNLRGTDGVGKLGTDILVPVRELPNVDVDTLYIGETCNRGPLLLDLPKLKELGYFDERNYFLDNSDHDLFARGFFYKQWICGYVPIDFHSPLDHGSTRKPRNEINERYYQHKRQSTQNGANGFLQTHLHEMAPRDIVQIPLR